MTRAKLAAGILVYRRAAEAIEVLLAHPGGPYWANKDQGAWAIPKGEAMPGEDLLACARRELAEETGLVVSGPFIELGHVRQKSGKEIHAWGAEGDGDPSAMRSNTFTMEWPPRSGRSAVFPEMDRCAWFDLAEAHRRILPAQADFLERLAGRLR